jgi:AraC-like DNA-binding protein
MYYGRRSKLIETPKMASFCIAENKHLRANIFPLHHHNVNELLFIIDGKGELTLEDHRLPVRKSDLILVKSNEDHVIIDEPSDLLHLYCVYFSDEVLRDQQGGDVLSQFIQELDVNRRRISTLYNPYFFHLPQFFREIMFEQNNPTEESPLLMRLIFVETLIRIKRFLQSNLNPSVLEANSLSPTERSVFSVIQYMEKNYYRNLVLEELAAMVPLGTRQFTRIFKKLTNMNFKEYIQELRINEAKRLLSTRQKGIKSVCFEVGFEDLSHFYRVFRKFTGTTPKNYVLNSRALSSAANRNRPSVASSTLRNF